MTVIVYECYCIYIMNVHVYKQYTTCLMCFRRQNDCPITLKYSFILWEPGTVFPTRLGVLPAKTQISLSIYAVRSESAQGTLWAT